MTTVGFASASRVFPWLKHLSAEHIEEFYTDFFNALERSLETQDWTTLEQKIERWQATAAILANTDLTAILTTPASADEVEEWEHVESELFGSSSQTGA